MSNLENSDSSKLNNSKGETLIELIISIFILTLVLTAIIAIFISGRAGVVESWDRTDKNECAGNVMEQLKSQPYQTLVDLERNSVYRVGGNAINIPYTDIFTGSDTRLECADLYEIEFDLLTFKGNPIEKIMQINVRIEKDGKGVEIGSLLRKGDSP